jgi:hypothetical protein
MTENKFHLRHIDRVLPSGEDRPMDLYTIDITPVHLLKKLGIKGRPILGEKEKKVAKVMQNVNRKKLGRDIETEGGATKNLWDN